MAVNKINFADL